ncbi:hypothetical protein JCM11641_000770 [Rhodosporidiobolus odoratus]
MLDKPTQPAATNLHRRISYTPPPPPPSPDDPIPLPQLGTILYEGPVPPTKGLWYGIEWDDSTRGKHSGIHDKTGVRYFETRVHGAGSFLRPEAKGLNVCGKTFKQALFSKYLDLNLLAPSAHPSSPLPEQQSESGSEATSQLYATERNFDVEVVLSKKVNDRFKQLGRLREVGLEWENVSRAVDEESEAGPEGVGQELSRLEILNLSYSLLPTLQEAERIATVLPRLRHLSLNSNRFARITSTIALPGLERLTSLQLNSTLLRWEEIRHVASSLTNLVELQFGFNRLLSLRPSNSTTPPTALPSRDPILPKLERLNLESNELEDWTEVVEELSYLPSLSSLILSSNRFTSLSLPPLFSATATALRKLRHLSLSDNLLSSWSTSLNVLASSTPLVFPALTSLRVVGNPFSCSTTTANPPLPPPSHLPVNNEDEDKEQDPVTLEQTRQSALEALHTRLLVIARMPTLLDLEGTAITPAERDDAERFWLERIEKGGGDDEGGLGEYAKETIEELRKKHGFPTPSAANPSTSDSAAPSKPTLKDRLIRLQLRPSPFLSLSSASSSSSSSSYSSSSSQIPNLELSVLPTLRTLLLRTQISRLLKHPLPKTKYRLVAILQGGVEGGGNEVEVDIPTGEEGKEVGWWGLGEGDSVGIEPM